jgi:NAD(P)-dependent dehydrogenase (short-subunit alcohol dehydrogenase family)
MWPWLAYSAVDDFSVARGVTDSRWTLAERLCSSARSTAGVFTHGRNRDRGQRLVAKIQASAGKAQVLTADYSSLVEVRRLADNVLASTDRLDALINNAGIGFGPGDARQLSVDSHELRFAVNYLAGFSLTSLLLPRLIESAPSRIVNVASAAQHPIDFDDVMLTRGYDGTRAYSQSKLAQIMFTFDLARELDPSRVTVNCLHPATYMDTTMVCQADIIPRNTTETGAQAIMRLAVPPELDGVTGKYFDGQRESRANPQASDLDARHRLRALSLQLTGLAARLP